MSSADQNRASNRRPHANLRRDLVILGSFFVALVVFFFAISGAKQTRMRVVGLAWKHEIKIEVFGPVADASWCDALPAEASQVRREREVRSTRPVPDGEQCSAVRHDNGDGTFRESQQCRTIYKKEPVYDDRCYYVVDRWHYARSLVARGDTLDAERRWPPVNLTVTGACLGCEREGEHVAEYVVSLQAVGTDQKRECAVPEARFVQFQPNSEWVADAATPMSALDCATLQPATHPSGS
jgi:hypothetical protein